MKFILKYIFVPLLIVLFSTCKKKTSIKVKVFNYAMAEPIANATVVLVQKKGEDGGGIIAGNADCTEIASATTNGNGECAFDDEKLRSGGKFSYFLAIKNAYGKDQNYPCGGKTSGFIEKGATQETILSATYFDAYIKVQYNNLLNPSQVDDSLIVAITSPQYTVPGDIYSQGGGGVFGAFPYYGCNGFPFPAEVTLNPIKTNAGKHVIHIRKRKMSIVTTSMDTVQVYPYQTTTININW